MPYRYPIKFGKYLLTRRIAVGGMAEVFKAKMVGIKGFEKILAVKRILPEFNDDEEFLQMFVDEARISSSLHHANVVQVYDFGQVAGSYYISMEYVDGPNLKNFAKRILRQQKAFPRNIAIYVISQLARGLEYAHSVRIEGEEVLNLVHRDVSPQNALLSRSGEVKITDFGIAKAAIKLSHTQPGKIQGKFSYMSPEQATGKSLDHRSDIFSLGIIAYELFTGIKLYASEDTQKRYRQVREAKFERLGALVPDLPAQVESLVMRMLEKNPDDRPQTCGEISSELTEILSNLSKEEMASELGHLVDEYFPREKSDSGIRRRVEEFINAEEPGTEIERAGKPEVEEDERSGITKPISAELTVAGEPPVRLSRKIVRILAAVTVLAAIVFLFLRNVGPPETTSSEEATGKSNEVLSDAPPRRGPVDSDIRAEALAREVEVEARLRELEEQLLDTEEKAYVTEKKLAKAEEKLKEAVVPPPLKPCPSDMVLIPAGSFIYGSDPNDKDRIGLVEPVAKEIPMQKFCIDRYEYPNQKGKTPRSKVAWSQAQEICTQEGKRLCTQGEWERGCKGPAKGDINRRYPYGNSWSAGSCNTEGPSTEEDKKGSLNPSGAHSRCKSQEGVYDMSGNLDEWTASHGRYDPSPDSRVTRGGSYKRPGWLSRCSSIRELSSSAKEADIGFRCCKDAR